MASFTNVATLSYGGNQVSSNVVTGEIREVLTVSKTAVPAAYAVGDTITYVIYLINSGTAALTDLTVTDDLGGYAFGAGTVYPLRYTDGTVRYFANGVLQAAPDVTAGPPLRFTGITVPAGGTAALVYQAEVTAYAPPTADGVISNTVTVSGGALAGQTATEEITASQAARLEITKALSPAVVAENGQLTYTFTIRNFGPTAVDAADDAAVTDTFSPVLNDITVTYNGTPWATPGDYTYSAATSVFSTTPGRITVPAASYTQSTDGTWVITPGTATLVVSGTIGDVYMKRGRPTACPLSFHKRPIPFITNRSGSGCI